MGAGRCVRDNGQVNGHSVKPAPGLLREARGWLPRLPASARSAGPPAAPAGRQVAADIALAMAAAAASLAVAALAVRHQAQVVVPAAGEPGWQAVLPVVAARTVPLALRRFRPLAAFWLCLAGCLLAAFPEPLRGSSGATAVDLITLVPAAYSALAHSPYRGAALLSTPAAVVVLALPSLHPQSGGNYTLLVTVLVFMAVVVVGNAVHVSRHRASGSQARLLRLQEEQEEATRRAIGQERARIASELHDVVTHNVSMMVVQAGAARRILGASPDEARSALLAIEESGRSAITELQHMLGLLTQPGEPEDAGRSAAQDTGPLRPQPGLDQVRPLIERVTAAGLPVELRVSGTPRALPPGMDLAAYRVVQEALTNVIKHAGQSSATVTLDYRDNALVVEVTDDGGPGEVSARHRGAPGALRAMPGGRGLLGLRERVLLYGGELDAGSQPGGGWRVSAQFPEQPSLAAIPVPS
jgi:signal transduction histidine kinase